MKKGNESCTAPEKYVMFANTVIGRRDLECEMVNCCNCIYSLKNSYIVHWIAVGEIK